MHWTRLLICNLQSHQLHQKLLQQKLQSQLQLYIFHIPLQLQQKFQNFLNRSQFAIPHQLQPQFQDIVQNRQQFTIPHQLQQQKFQNTVRHLHLLYIIPHQWLQQQNLIPHQWLQHQNHYHLEFTPRLIHFFSFQLSKRFFGWNLNFTIYLLSSILKLKGDTF